MFEYYPPYGHLFHLKDHKDSHNLNHFEKKSINNFKQKKQIDTKTNHHH